MTRYITKAELEVNGQVIDDFKSVEIGEVEHRVAVNLMNKTGFAGKTPRHMLTVEYVVPAGTPFDWASLEDGTLTAEYDDGTRESYKGVCTLKEGAKKADGEGEMVQTIELLAEGKQ